MSRILLSFTFPAVCGQYVKVGRLKSINMKLKPTCYTKLSVFTLKVLDALRIKKKPMKIKMVRISVLIYILITIYKKRTHANDKS